MAAASQDDWLHELLLELQKNASSAYAEFYVSLVAQNTGLPVPQKGARPSEGEPDTVWDGIEEESDREGVVDEEPQRVRNRERRTTCELYCQQPNKTKMGYSGKWKKNGAELSHDTIKHQPIYSLCSLPEPKARCCNNHDSEEGSVSGNSQYSATDRESTHSGTLSHISSFGGSLVQDQEHRCSTPYVSYFDAHWTVLCGKRDNYLTLPPKGMCGDTQIFSQPLSIK